LTITKTIVKYPMDTATVRLQMMNTTYSIYNITELFSNSYIGIVTPLLFNIPAGAIFFAVKDTISSILKSISPIPISSIVIDDDSNNENISSLLLLIVGLFLQPINWIIDQCHQNRTFRTCIAVLVAQIPYWLVRNPSEVIKTKEQAIGTTMNNNVNNVDDVVDQPQYNNNKTSILDQIKYYYTGYWENVIYAYPADVLKFVCYEQLSTILVTTTSTSSMNQQYDNDNNNNNLQYALQSAWSGAIATALAQYITTPLDVIRNRVMVNTDGTNSISYHNNNYLTTSSIANNTNMTILSSGDTYDHSNNGTMIDVVGKRQSSSTSILSFILLYVQSLLQLGRSEGYDGLFAGAIPRLMKAFISGAIQFATYEETKQALLNFLSNNP
jgi:solute carrier family 25 (mitochondrial S-adenosylmethionine transporter), member 26